MSRCSSRPVPISTFIMGLSFVEGSNQDHLNQRPVRVHLACKEGAYVRFTDLLICSWPRPLRISVLTLPPQQRVLLIYFPDSLTVLRKGIDELCSCTIRRATSAQAVLVQWRCMCRALSPGCSKVVLE